MNEHTNMSSNTGYQKLFDLYAHHAFFISNAQAMHASHHGANVQDFGAQQLAALVQVHAHVTPPPWVPTSNNALRCSLSVLYLNGVKQGDSQVSESMLLLIHARASTASSPPLIVCLL